MFELPTVYYEPLLWLQMAYSLWVFFRSAKFFRIPYVLLSSLWHKGLYFTLPTRKNVAHLVHDGPSITEPSSKRSIRSVNAGVRAIIHVGGKRVLCDHAEIPDIENLLGYYDCGYLFTMSRDILLPEVSLIKKPLTNVEIVGKYLEGYRPVMYKERSFVEQSSGKEINRDFMKLVSILPLYLQAKDYNTLSCFASMAIIVFDIFSYLPNYLWHSFKLYLYRTTKLALAKLEKKRRVYFHTFLSTISSGFMYCDQTICKSYYTDKDIYIVEPGVLPSYVGVHVATNKDQTRHPYENTIEYCYTFFVNDMKHEYSYKYSILNDSYEVRRKNDGIDDYSYEVAPETFMEELSFLEQIENDGLYPMLDANEEGVHALPAKNFFETLYDYRGIKFKLLKPVLVSGGAKV